MLKQDDCIVVLDVGKTNKKLLIYNSKRTYSDYQSEKDHRTWKNGNT